jgi:hypothetical protein
MNVEVEVFSAVVGPHSYGNQRLQRQFDRLLIMGIIMPIIRSSSLPWSVCTSTSTFIGKPETATAV